MPPSIKTFHKKNNTNTPCTIEINLTACHIRVAAHLTNKPHLTLTVATLKGGGYGWLANYGFRVMWCTRV